MRKRARRIPAFMNSGKGSLLTRLTLSGDFSFGLRLTKNPRGFCLLLIPRERVSKWNNWRLQSVNSKGYKINLFVNFHFTTHIKYFNNLFSAKPMRRRPWESRSKFGMGSTQSQCSILNSQFSNSILNSQFSGTGSTQARQQDRVVSLFWLLASAPVRFPRFISSLASNCFFFSKLHIPFACLESHTTDN